MVMSEYEIILLIFFFLVICCRVVANLIAANVQGLLPLRTSKVMNVRRPSGVTYFKTPQGRTEP